MTLAVGRSLTRCSLPGERPSVAGRDAPGWMLTLSGIDSRRPLILVAGGVILHIIALVEGAMLAAVLGVLAIAWAVVGYLSGARGR